MSGPNGERCLKCSWWHPLEEHPEYAICVLHTGLAQEKAARIKGAKSYQTRHDFYCSEFRQRETAND
jgi:hypothetical protein